jgi:hypothetical protein
MPYTSYVYDYFLPGSPALEAARPSRETLDFALEEAAFWPNSSWAAKRDFYELFPGLKEQYPGDLDMPSAPYWDLYHPYQQPEPDDSEQGDSENEEFVERGQHAPLAPSSGQQPAGGRRANARRSKLRWDVPIVLKGAEVVACPDTGSEQNILSKEVATQLGILDQLDSSRSGRFVLGNGRDVQSLGAVDIEFTFAQEPEILLKCMFHVFESLIRPAILGGVFLRHTETLTKHRQRRLRQTPIQTSSLWQIMHIGVARERFECYVDNNLVDVRADTGSEMDLVSKDFVRKSSHRPRALQDRLPVEFADGSIGWISHQIFTRFSPDLEKPKSAWSGQWFYVLDDLPCEILLGEETLDRLNAFNRETSFTMHTLDSDGIELCTIFWASHLERKMTAALRFFEKGRPTKRKNDAEGKTMRDHRNLFD